MLSPHPAASESSAGKLTLPPPLQGGLREARQRLPPPGAPKRRFLRKEPWRRGGDAAQGAGNRNSWEAVPQATVPEGMVSL